MAADGRSPEHREPTSARSVLVQQHSKTVDGFGGRAIASTMEGTAGPRAALLLCATGARRARPGRPGRNPCTFEEGRPSQHGDTVGR